jgi:hypothetical protein
VSIFTGPAADAYQSKKVIYIEGDYHFNISQQGDTQSRLMIRGRDWRIAI